MSGTYLGSRCPGLGRTETWRSPGHSAVVRVAWVEGTLGCRPIHVTAVMFIKVNFLIEIPHSLKHGIKCRLLVHQTWTCIRHEPVKLRCRGLTSDAQWTWTDSKGSVARGRSLRSAGLFRETHPREEKEHLGGGLNIA